MDNFFDISIDYVKSITQANELRKIANRCEDIKHDIAKELSYAESIWIGQAGDALCNNLRQAINKSEGISESLYYTANRISGVANDIKEADIESSRRLKSNK